MFKSKVAKVPVIMQMEALECGAASLAMILAYHGKWLPLEKVRADCGVSRDGSNLKDMSDAAQSYGLQVDAYRCGMDDVKTLPLPAIIHWNFNHFVVLNGFKKNKAVINDPARGTVEVSMDDFDRSFTGIIVCFEKTEKFVADGKKKSVLSFAKKRLKGTLVPFIFVILTGLLVTFIGIINPVFTRIFMDRILSGENPEWLMPVLSGMATLVVFQIIVQAINIVYMLKIKGKLAIVANSMFMWHVLRLPMHFFSQRQIGDIAMRQASNEGIAEVLIQSLAPILLNAIMLVFYFFMVINISWPLTLLGLTAVIINMFLANYISKKRINITRAQMRDVGKLASTTVSGIEMIETIKSSGAENGFFEKWSGYQASVNSSVVKFSKINEYIGAIPAVLQGLANMAVLLIGAMFIMQGTNNFTAGILMMFQGYLGKFIEPLESFRGIGQQIQEMRTDMERIEDVMNYEPDVDYDGLEIDENAEYSKLTGEMQMKNVTFGYKPLGEPLIKDFNLTLKPGSTVAFVGASGCGKSTLSKLISGLYKPWSGEITFDGNPISDVNREIFTSSVAVVDQDIILFEDTIADNIKMWDKSISDTDMIVAAKDAHIHEDIMLKDGGYSHKVLEGGKNFSGGQRQRLEIARTLAKDPTIIILDEATSALDAKTEHDVIKSITDRGVTCIIVAHRLSTIRDCDEIIVLDKGRVIERGTHNELFANNGVYSQLITTE